MAARLEQLESRVLSPSILSTTDLTVPLINTLAFPEAGKLPPAGGCLELLWVNEMQECCQKTVQPLKQVVYVLLP